MSDRMTPIPFAELLDIMLQELQCEGSIFGIPRADFYTAQPECLPECFGRKPEALFGPAAGPHTQLAQNIVAGYLTGARFFELKTVQTLDGEDLQVSKPCIALPDECYNVEWSTELRVEEALEEYIKAWLALAVLSRLLGLGSSKGFIFNMSVGYSLEGIQSPKIDAFIEGLKDASHTQIWQECMATLHQNLHRLPGLDEAFLAGISPEVCCSITLSTLHGCPAQEIESIAAYLLTQKRLHTYVKCNPTLLGYDFVRTTLNGLGYEYLDFGTHHFENDLQFDQAIPMLQRLQALAGQQGLSFGVKLSNTFPVKTQGRLAGEEMYLSGRALYPLTINLAHRIAQATGGSLPISFSGGLDALNIAPLYAAGIYPLTLATTLLKPGGYQRLHQIAGLLQDCALPGSIDLAALQALAQDALTNKLYCKSSRFAASRKLPKPLPLLDCAANPCQSGCPIGQDIPEYLALVAQQEYVAALEVITHRNPLPFSTGSLCNHNCMSCCTRIDYEQPLDIRGAKLLAAKEGFAGLMAKRTTPPRLANCPKVAIIGAGPAGLSAGYFLAQAGLDVTIFDKADKPGGVIQSVIPSFRISQDYIEKDMALIASSGVKFAMGASPELSVEKLRQDGYEYIFLAIGAWKSPTLQLQTCEGKVYGVLEFLEAFHTSCNALTLGKHVVVVGGGNSAMDAARAAKRLPGVESVTIVYRRTRSYMPAEAEELELALHEGVALCELAAPLALQQGQLLCQKMQLGEPDASGRRRPVPLEGQTISLPADSVIAAIGEQVDTQLLTRNGIVLEKGGWVAANPHTGETNLPGVFIGGDALRGPSTIVQAIADGRRFADTVLQRLGIAAAEQAAPNAPACPTARTGRLCPPTLLPQEAARCLACGQSCGLCAQVCPNRANRLVQVQGRPQLLHLDAYCNECGNCEAACPYTGAPYREKFTLFATLADFEASENPGFVPLGQGRVLLRLGGMQQEFLLAAPPAGIDTRLLAFMEEICQTAPHCLCKA